MKLLTKFVILCVVYCLTNKVTQQSAIGDITTTQPPKPAQGGLNVPPWGAPTNAPDATPRNTYKKMYVSTRKKIFKSRFDHLFESISDWESEQLPFAPVTDLDEWFIIQKRLEKKLRKLSKTTPTTRSANNKTESEECTIVYLLNKKDRMKLRAKKFWAEEIKANPEYTKFYIWIYKWLHADWNTNKRRIHAYDTHTTPPYETAKLFTPFPVPPEYMKFFLFHWHMEQVFKEQDQIAPFTGLEPMKIGSV